MNFKQKYISKEKKESSQTLEIGKQSAISPEGWQVEERGLSLCALCLPISNNLAYFLFFEKIIVVIKFY